MEREHRYLVVKFRDMLSYLTEKEQFEFLELTKKIDAGRDGDGRRVLECVCVESDWPEYDETWWKIASRVDREESGLSPLASKIDQIERYGYKI